MSASPYATQASVAIARGPVGAGKTEWLVQRVAEAMRTGTPADQIVAFAATPQACSILKARLRERLDDAAMPEVSTVREFALKVLGSPEARRRTRRPARILMRFEENVLMEDMKTSGVQPRRLGEMLRFFYRSIADLEPMEADWFYNDEERKVFGLLGRLLDHYGAYLEYEVSRAALQLVSSDPTAFAPARRRCVFADDYQTLSKASQCLAAALATEELSVAADDLARVESMERYPQYSGTDLLAEGNPGCMQVELQGKWQAPAVARALDKIVSDPALAGRPLHGEPDGEGGSFDLLPFSRPSDEFDGIASRVRAAVEEGTPPDRIAVAASNGIWARNIAKALGRAGIPASRPERLVVGCDVRDLGRCEEARAVTLVALAADPDDQLALRCWCGFGDYLANSGLFSDLAVRGERISLSGRLEASSADALTVQELVKANGALQSARSSLGCLAGLTGERLARTAWERARTGSAPIPAWLIDAAGKDLTAAETLERIRARAAFPQRDGEGVFVGCAEDMAGLDVQVMAVSGLVNGFTPPRSYFDPTVVERDKRPELLAREMAKVYCCAGKAQRALALSYFTEVPLADAERLKLKVFRIRLRDGERLCEVRPSEAIRSLTGVRFDG